MIEVQSAILEKKCFLSTYHLFELNELENIKYERNSSSMQHKKIEILIEGSQGPGIFLSYIRIKFEPPD
jgi:hypothetical protein